MSLQFTPKSEDDLKTAQLLPAGEYEFEVLSAEHAVSKKSGNPMIKLKVGIFRPDGTQAHIFDYLIGTMETKLRHFCDSTGLLPKYQAGTLSPQDCEGRSGKLKLVIEKGTGDFPPKNSVKDYSLRKAKPIAPEAPTQAATEDDVPF